MRSIEDKKLCYQESNNNNGNLVFEFHNKLNNTSSRNHSHRSTALGKLSTPSKWDDAQKWLVGLSRGNSGVGDHHKNSSAINKHNHHNNNNRPRNSNADDLRLIASVPHRDDEEYYSSEQEQQENELVETTKNVDQEAIWRINRPVAGSTAAAATIATVVRSVCVRDMGTEMTPIGSQEPSRTATPVRATTPVARSPIPSGCSTPIRAGEGPTRGNVGGPRRCVEENSGNLDHSNDNNSSNYGNGNVGNMNPLETRALAWDEAERAKYMARYKREEVKIQAWENHEKRKAEMEMKKIEVKAERMKARAEEKMSNKLTATRRIAEEKRANAEAKLNEKAVRTSERADYIRRTGHLPSSFSFKLPSLCW